MTKTNNRFVKNNGPFVRNNRMNGFFLYERHIIICEIVIFAQLLTNLRFSLLYEKIILYCISCSCNVYPMRNKCAGD